MWLLHVGVRQHRGFNDCGIGAGALVGTGAFAMWARLRHRELPSVDEAAKLSAPHGRSIGPASSLRSHTQARVSHYSVCYIHHALSSHVAWDLSLDVAYFISHQHFTFFALARFWPRLVIACITTHVKTIQPASLSRLPCLYLSAPIRPRNV